MHIEDAIGKFDVGQMPSVKTGHIDPLALQMGDLYSECVRQVISDDEIRFHVVLMPDMTGSHFLFAAGAPEEEDLANDVEMILGIDIGPDDCIVLLGRQMLQIERNEDEMMEIVLGDIALHIDRVWPVADRSSGWMGSYIGYAAISSIIASAHNVLKMLAPSDALISRIKDRAEEGLKGDKRIRCAYRELAQNRPAFEAIEMVCDTAHETQGCYMTLPNTARNLRNTAKTLFIETVDSMGRPFRTVI